jgi:predicted membrane channel-forming protein YqfA (hemolysin III family)
MDSDLILVTGVVIGVFAVPAIISAISDRRTPRVAALVLIAAGCMVVWAIQSKSAGYSITDVPNAFVRVVGKYIY